MLIASCPAPGQISMHEIPSAVEAARTASTVAGEGNGIAMAVFSMETSKPRSPASARTVDHRTAAAANVSSSDADCRREYPRLEWWRNGRTRR